MEETKYYKVINCSGNVTCATKFDEKVDFARRIEVRELLRMNEYTMVEITEEEYNKTPNKLDAV
jgi:hypothetical protein